jgi:hypothetical protein
MSPAAPTWEQMLADAMAPLPDEYRWVPWGYELPEQEEPAVPLPGPRPDDTQYLPVIDFVMANEFPGRIPAQRTGAVL